MQESWEAYLIHILIGLLVILSWRTSVAVRAASDRCARPLATHTSPHDSQSMCALYDCHCHPCWYPCAPSVVSLCAVTSPLHVRHLCWPSVAGRCEAARMANRLIDGGQSNAAVVCIKLLLTVFNFIFWVSNRHASIGCKSASRRHAICHSVSSAGLQRRAHSCPEITDIPQILSLSWNQKLSWNFSHLVRMSWYWPLLCRSYGIAFILYLVTS